MLAPAVITNVADVILVHAGIAPVAPQNICPLFPADVAKTPDASLDTTPAAANAPIVKLPADKVNPVPIVAALVTVSESKFPFPPPDATQFAELAVTLLKMKISSVPVAF